MRKPVLGQKAFMRLVVRTFSIEEAHRISEQFQSQGYNTNIVENKHGSVAVFEVWAGKGREGFEIGTKSKIKPKFLSSD